MLSHRCISLALRTAMTRTGRLCGSRPAVVFVGALLFAGIVSASINPGAIRRQATATSAGTEASMDFESLTGCHMHGTNQYCMADSTEYQIVPEAAEATATEDPPSSYTACHNHGSDVYCMNPKGGEVQVLAENEAVPTQTAAKETAKSAASDSAKITAVTECHMHETSLYCMGPSSTEYYVQTSITNTEEFPAQLTDCHSHGEETYCMSDDGEAPIILAEDVESGAADPEEEHCHFHAGVEHCVGGSHGSEEGGARSCGRVDRDYKIGIRIGMLFVVLVASSIGVFGPILMSTFMPIKSNLFLIVLKQFGTGVVISTAFVHLFTHATMMFGNECLGELLYEATTAAIVMAGLFISFLIEYFVNRVMRWQENKENKSEGVLSQQALAKAELTNVTIMEAGIIFHSLLIGITLVVAGDSFFITLSIVIIFHQLFEGIALGTRIAAAGYGQTPLAHFHSHGHSHSPAPVVDRSGTSSVSLTKKLILGAGFALVTPIGMGIGIGVLNVFNGNNPSTLIALGTLDALSAGILVWVGLVEMWAQDWMWGGELTEAGPITTTLALFGLVCGMVLMSVLGKWA
ncbi:high-affinity Zn(2+) transporter zrt1 [Fusarium piperis]|uniref:High-affinity Zn(2+) transporter zrt1 n=1 Tax=Fusarium piperis TaxID=1435070 RepID=A0A9W9BQI0_9HYPO|nr:high-affinity Zn(2+) transporter zrt1 [Fusarium piperis]